MPWINSTIASSLGGITAAAHDAVLQVQGKLAKLNSQVGAINGALNAAVGAIAISRNVLDNLMLSGFYMITLPPGQGSWANRLAIAPNAPPESGFCCGVATLAITADLAGAEGAYAKVADAVMAPMADASNIVNPFDYEGFEPDPVPGELEELDEEALAAKPWSETFTPGEWKSATLGDVFGGYTEGIARATNKASKDAKSLLAGVNQVQRSSFAIGKGLTVTQNLITQLENTGVYNIALPPGAGGYLTRLQAEAGAPPTNPVYYSSGYVCIAVATSLNALASRYATLSSIVTGG